MSGPSIIICQALQIVLGRSVSFCFDTLSNTPRSACKHHSVSVLAAKHHTLLTLWSVFRRTYTGYLRDISWT